MNTIGWVIVAFIAGAGLVWLNFDDRRHAEQQVEHYRHMVCLFQADVQRGIQPEHARGWPDFYNRGVRCD